jgi:hypothetical protein
LRKNLGDALADELITIAKQIPAIPDAPANWLNRLTAIPEIDTGEAQLLAFTAQHDVLFLTGDKRALRALKTIPDFITAVAEKVITPEAVLLSLCTSRGDDLIRRQIQPALHLDKTLQVCFSAGNRSPREALTSYIRADEIDLAPLLLWCPQGWSRSA